MRALNPLEVRGLTNLICLVENMKVNKVYLCVGNGNYSIVRAEKSFIYLLSI